MTRALLVLCLLGKVALAAPTVAVLPLHDLAGGRPNLGAALRETLTVDLARTKDVKVVERALVDRVMREQDTARDPAGALGVRVGTLLGATHLVAGAYQRDGERLRVTARVIVVETGVVAGSAKADGALDRVLELQDKLDAELLRAMGWREPPPRHAHVRVAPRAIELFGDAALEPDVEKKKRLLRESVQAGPSFTYAADALAELEGRLAQYAARRDAALTDREQALTKARRYDELFPQESNARRYHALLRSTDAAPASEPRAYYAFVALDGLRRVDDALAAGERFLREHPGSPHFADVEKRVRALADERREEHARRADHDRDLADKLTSKDPADRDWAPCIAARWNRQYNQLMVDGCRAYLEKHGALADPTSVEHSRAARLFVILAYGQMGSFDAMRGGLADFRRRYPDGDQELDEKLAVWPSD